MPIQPKQQPPYYKEGINIKKLVFRLHQTSTNIPTTTIFENTIGTIVWTRPSIGFYRGTLTGAFPEDKTWIGNSDDPDNRLVMYPISVTGINKEAYQLYRESDDTIVVQIYDANYDNIDLSTYTTYLNMPEIRVYNT